MRKEAIINYVRHPDQLDSESVPVLEKLLSEFPYFQTGQLLLAKNLHIEDSIHYNQALKKAAIYAGDRKGLYQLILQPVLQKHLQEVAEVVDTEEATPEIETIETTESVAEKEETPVEEVEPVEAKESTTPLPDQKAAEPAPIETEESVSLPQEEEEKVELEAKPIDLDAIDPLEQEILRSAISASLEQEVMEFDETEASTMESDSTIESTAETIVEEPLATVSPAPTEPEAPTKPVEDRSFSDWLKVLSDDPEEGIEHVAEAKLPEAAIEEEKTTSSDLIDRFIREEPALEPPKADFFNPSNMARMSLAEDESFVTETLAEIYAKQGYIDKAIRAFRQLSLNNPEKSSYFATRIKELKKK